MRAETREIIDIIRSIPGGRVMTYGQIALSAGLYNGARQVVWVLRSFSEKYSLPWHRVINARGFISLKNQDSALQKKKLEMEGVKVSKEGRINLDIYRYDIN